MELNQILDEIKNIAETEIANGNTTESNKRLENAELLWGALALLGYSYSQIRGLKEGEDAADFWPFGKFNPSESPKENLLKACQLIIFEVDRLYAN